MTLSSAAFSLIEMNKMSLKFFPKGPINNLAALDLIMAWQRPGNKPLSEPMVVRLHMHTSITRPEYVNFKWLLLYFLYNQCQTNTGSILPLNMPSYQYRISMIMKRWSYDLIFIIRIPMPGKTIIEMVPRLSPITTSTIFAGNTHCIGITAAHIFMAFMWFTAKESIGLLWMICPSLSFCK